MYIQTYSGKVPSRTTGPVYSKNDLYSVAFYQSISHNDLGVHENSQGILRDTFKSLSDNIRTNDTGDCVHFL